MKFLKLSITMVLALFVFASCTYEEQQFLEALQQMENVGSYDAVSELSFDLQFIGDSRQKPESVIRAQPIFNNLVITSNINHRMVENDLQMFVRSTTNLDPFAISYDFWIHTNPDEYINRIVVRIPAFVRAFLPLEYNKDYFVMDLLDMMSVLEEEIPDLMENVDLSRQLGISNVLEILNLFQLAELSGMNLITSSQGAGGATTLTLSISDEQLKSIILFFARAIEADEALRDSLVDAILQFWLPTNDPGTSFFDPFNLIFGGAILNNWIQELVTEIITFIEEDLSDVPLLGESGFVYSITLNNDGYIVQQDTSLEIRLDGLARLADDIVYFYEGDVSSLTIRYQTSYSNINTATPIPLPVLHEGNSIRLSEIIYQQEQDRLARERERQTFRFLNTPSVFLPYMGDIFESPGTFPIRIETWDAELESYIYIMYTSEGFAAPVHQLAEILGGTVTHVGDTSAIVWTMPFDSLWQEGYINFIVMPYYIYFSDDLSGRYFDYILEHHLTTFDVLLIAYPYDDMLFIALTEWRHHAWFYEFGFDVETGTVIVRYW